MISDNIVTWLEIHVQITKNFMYITGESSNNIVTYCRSPPDSPIITVNFSLYTCIHNSLDLIDSVNKYAHIFLQSIILHYHNLLSEFFTENKGDC